MEPKKVFINLVTRMDWGAMPARTGTRHKDPAKYVILSITETPSCDNNQDCIIALQQMQRDHMFDLGLTDIAYNFLIGADGIVYEGRGWKTLPLKNKVRPEVHNDSIEISYIGQKDVMPGSEHIIEVVNYLLAYGSETGEIAKNTVLIPLFDICRK